MYCSERKVISTLFLKYWFFYLQNLKKCVENTWVEFFERKSCPWRMKVEFGARYLCNSHFSCNFVDFWELPTTRNHEVTRQRSDLRLPTLQYFGISISFSIFSAVSSWPPSLCPRRDKLYLAARLRVSMIQTKNLRFLSSSISSPLSNKTSTENSRSEFPHQTDHNLSIVWRHTNIIQNFIYNHARKSFWSRLWAASSHESSWLWLTCYHKWTRLRLARNHKWTRLWSACSHEWPRL